MWGGVAGHRGRVGCIIRLKMLKEGCRKCGEKNETMRTIINNVIKYVQVWRSGMSNDMSIF